MATKKADKLVAAKPVGRPTSYKPEYADLGRKFCLLGANNIKLAQMFDVADSTLSLWLANIPEFSDAVKEGREIADAQVAHSLYQRALGYQHPEDDIRVVNGAIVITPTIKQYPPDTGAATLWLKNRQPDTWRDKVVQEHTGTIGVRQLSDDDLMAIAAKG